MTPESAHSPACPVLLVRTPDDERSLPAGRSYVIGRDPQSDIFVNDSRVSWRHAVLRQEGVGWLLEDVGSTNGTFQGRDRIQRVSIAGSCSVRLGHPDDGPAMSCSFAAPAAPATPGGGVRPAGGPATRYVETPGSPPPNPAVGRLPGDLAGAGRGGGGRYAGGAPGGGPVGTPAATPGAGFAGPPANPAVPSPRLSMERMPSQVLRLPDALARIGRAEDNQIVVADLSVSRYHAELRRDPRRGASIVDLRSHHRTFLNRQQLGS